MADGINLTTLYTQIEGWQRRSGFFDRVAMHEPKASPGRGLTSSTWLQQVSPVQRVSGLSVTSARVEVITRIYQNFVAEPQDRIDPDTYAAADYLLGQYHSDFTLGGVVDQIDLLGAYGNPLGVRAGYLNQDGDLYRVLDITCPMILFDVWTQAP
ncbi:MAG: hypothetical protein GY925_16865 [Actinomycetia bacterium]|nr:hypothetical protein [Actinomycetes bacterium]